jgi:hypothetical protein
MAQSSSTSGGRRFDMRRTIEPTGAFVKLTAAIAEAADVIDHRRVTDTPDEASDGRHGDRVRGTA